MKKQFIVYILWFMAFCGLVFAQDELVSLDFDNVDLRVIIKFMSELTGKNFIVDESVKGTATVISPTKIPVDEAYKVLESILLVNGYTIVPEGNMIKVVPIPKAEEVFVYHVENTDSVSLSQVLSKVYLERKKEEGVIRPPTIVADSISNSLIILTTPQEYAFLEGLIKKLDTRKPQVLVEAVIAEVSLEKTMELGLELVAAGGVVYGSGRGFSGTQTKGVAENILTGGGLPTTTLGVVEGETTRAGITMPNLGMLVTASKDSDDINILSAPQLLATDNQEAQILVGRKLAFIKNTQVTPEGSTVRTFEYKDVGLLLKITPHITEDDYVRMDITQQVEDVVGQSFEGAVETSKREAVTSVTVKNNTTAVIGGLLLDKKKESIEKVPLLGDIPILNLLFKRTKSSNEKMNLFIFITPHIVRTDSEIIGLTEERKGKVGQ